MRDDIDKLALPRIAKAFARRGGLKSMMRQPKDFLAVNKVLVNPGLKGDKFKSRDAVGPVKQASNESIRRLAERLIEELVGDSPRNEAISTITQYNRGLTSLESAAANLVRVLDIKSKFNDVLRLFQSFGKNPIPLGIVNDLIG